MKNNKNVILKYKLPLLIIAAGIIVMVIASFTEKFNKKEGENTFSANNSYSDNAENLPGYDFEEYADYEEKRLEGLLSKIEGAGKIKAAVYVSSTPAGDDEGLVFPEIKGVLVYAEGAAKNTVKEKIIKAVSSLYGIPLCSVNVVC
jgi:hypothetical protein